MIKPQHIFFILTLVFSSLNVTAQDQLLFLNGKTLDGKILNQTEYEFSFQDKKNKQYSIDKYRVFSFKKNNTESIVYKYDTLEGNFLKVADMKMFVYGEKDAHLTYNSHFASAIGLAIGSTAGYFMHKDQSFFYVITPLVYTTLTLPFGTSIKKQDQIKTKNFLKEDEYLRGYDRVARSKRTSNALKSSFVGMAAGFIVSVIVNN
ncbi:MAG: hypothetical protein ACPGSO_01085 [Vicingaceae bacterium]